MSNIELGFARFTCIIFTPNLPQTLLQKPFPIRSGT